MELKWIAIAIAVIAITGNLSRFLINRDKMECVIELGKMNRSDTEIKKLCE